MSADVVTYVLCSAAVVELLILLLIEHRILAALCLH